MIVLVVLSRLFTLVNAYRKVQVKLTRCEFLLIKASNFFIYTKISEVAKFFGAEKISI